MGNLTTVTIYNDALHTFRENPEGFAKAIFEGIDKANYSRKEESVGFMNYCNYISVQPSRHADDHTVYVHRGNSVFNINPWNADFKEMVERNPDIALDYLKTVELLLDECMLKAKEAKKAQKAKGREVKKKFKILWHKTWYLHHTEVGRRYHRWNATLMQFEHLDKKKYQRHMNASYGHFMVWYALDPAGVKAHTTKVMDSLE